MSEGSQLSSTRDKHGRLDRITNTELRPVKYDSMGLRYPTSVLKFKRDLKNRFHPTQKPVALMEYLIKTYTNENETVLDFTMGSGTTGVACKQTNRKFIGIEKDEEYFKIAEKRINEARNIVEESHNSMVANFFK